MLDETNEHVKTGARPGKGKKKKSTTKAKVAASAQAEPKLTIKIGGKRRSVDPAKLLDNDTVTELHDACAKSENRPCCFSTKLLDVPDHERFLVLEFVASLNRYRVAIGEKRHDTAFDAILTLMVDMSDMAIFTGVESRPWRRRCCGTARLDGACVRIRSAMRELGVKGVKVADVIRDARQIKKALSKRGQIERIESNKPYTRYFPRPRWATTS